MRRVDGFEHSPDVMPSKYSAPKAQAMEAAKVKDQFDNLICNCCAGGTSTFVASVLCPCAVLGSNVAMVQTGGRVEACTLLERQYVCCNEDHAGQKECQLHASLIGGGCLAAALTYALAPWPLNMIGNGVLVLGQVPTAIHGARHRRLIRKDLHITSANMCIPGNFGDVVCHSLMHPLALVQEHRELWDAKHKSKLVKKGYLDGPADKAPTTQEFEVRYDCSCAMCAARFDTMAELIAHLGGEHDVGQINRVLSSGKGTVKCDRCRETFPTCAVMKDHECTGARPMRKEPKEKKRSARLADVEEGSDDDE